MRLAIIIPTYNRKSNIEKLLKQLSSQWTGNCKIKIIVVVDGSTDGTQEMLTNYFPEVNIVKGTGNWWYTKCINEGIKYSEQFKPDYILTLNDDIEIEDNYIQNMIETVERVEPDSIIGSISYTADKPYRITSSGVKKIIWWRNKLVKYHKMFEIISPDSLSGIKPSIVLPGRGMIIPFKVLKELNYFDEYFVQYHSDADFCLRAQQKGYKVYISWDAKIFSFVDQTAAGTSFLKTPIIKFLKSFFIKQSRLYIPQISLYIYRHDNKLLWPITMVITIAASLKAHFFSKKINV